QARVCAAHLAEHGGTRYRGSHPAAQLKVTGIDLFSAGQIEAQAGAETLRFVDAARGVYKRLLLQGGRLRGIVLSGDTRHAAWYADLMETGRDVTELRDQLLFGPPGAMQRQA